MFDWMQNAYSETRNSEYLFFYFYTLLPFCRQSPRTNPTTQDIYNVIRCYIIRSLHEVKQCQKAEQHYYLYIYTEYIITRTDVFVFWFIYHHHVSRVFEKNTPNFYCSGHKKQMATVVTSSRTGPHRPMW
jgi:hypothetical protein